MIKLIFMVFLLGAYAVFGAACLRVLKVSVSFSTVGGFVAVGAISAAVSFIAYGVFVAEQFGLLGEGDKVAGVFIVSAIISVTASVATAKFIAKRETVNRR